MNDAKTVKNPVFQIVPTCNMKVCFNGNKGKKFCGRKATWIRSDGAPRCSKHNKGRPKRPTK